MGSCMVSSEGACAAYWTYGRFRKPEPAKEARDRMNHSETGAPGLSGSVDMTHGGGGRFMAELIRTLFRRHLSNPILDQGNDGALRRAAAGTAW